MIDFVTYTNMNGNVNQKEYISYEDPEKKIEKIIYNGKPYWKHIEQKRYKTERNKSLFRKHVHFEKQKQNKKTHKIYRQLTPFSKKEKKDEKERKHKK